MTKVKYTITINDTPYELEVTAKMIDGQLCLDGAETIKAQEQLALKFLKELSVDEITPEHFNFFLNITGLKVKDIAMYVDMNPAHISQYRRDKRLSSGVWTMFKVFFRDYLTHNNTVTIDTFKENFQKNQQKAS